MLFFRILVFLSVLLLSFNLFSKSLEDIESELLTLKEQQKMLLRELALIKEQQSAPVSSPSKKSFKFGGYGEMHFQDEQGGKNDLSDIHRSVLFLGYDFDDKLRFHSELEIEHAYIQDESGKGEILFEQFYFDWLKEEKMNLRLGRVLVPAGLINLYHEPTQFAGVERPTFHNRIIPTTWSADGFGLWGNFNKKLNYQIYTLSGLDGSQITSGGIRNSRIKERPGMGDLSIAGRLEWFPQSFNTDFLRIGTSYFSGKLNNKNKTTETGLNSSLKLRAFDLDLREKRFHLRGEWAQIDISNPLFINTNIAEEIQGWYIETGWHFLKKYQTGYGKDALFFIRYDQGNTQEKLANSTTPDLSNDQSEWVYGVNYWPTKDFVLKMDYTQKKDKSGKPLKDFLRLGAGYAF